MKFLTLVLQNQLNLRGTVASSGSVRVLRDTGFFENISSKELVPGDLIELPKHQVTLVCDVVLLTGQCVLNESMLTGEILQFQMRFSNFASSIR